MGMTKIPRIQFTVMNDVLEITLFTAQMHNNLTYLQPVYECACEVNSPRPGVFCLADADEESQERFVDHRPLLIVVHSPCHLSRCPHNSMGFPGAANSAAIEQR